MNGWDILLKMAKALLISLLVVLLSALVHGSAWNADFEELEEKVEAKLDVSGMQEGDEQLLRRLYGLNADEGQMELIRQAAEKRVDTQKNNFEGYGPEQLKLIEKYVLREAEPYVLFVISEDAESIKEEFVKGMYQ